MTESIQGRATSGAPPAGLWLATLQRIAGRAAHEVKNSLNGVAVNLEVVRSRAARAGTAADAVSRFAESASEQLERLTAQTEALLALVREARDPCDVNMVAGHLHALLGGLVLAGQEAQLLALEKCPGAATTRVRGETVRLLLGEIVLAAIEQGAPLAVRVEGGEGGAAVVVRGATPETSLPALTPAMEALAQGDGITLERQADALILRFAAPAR